MSEPRWKHGTVYGYRKKGCRCFWCKEAEQQEHQETRQRARQRNSPGHQRELATNRARKERYRGTCRTCGKPTTGCYGPGLAPELCAACYRAANLAPHGTRSAYSRGCRCAECTRTQRDAMRDYRRRREGGGGSSPPRPPTLDAS